MDKIEKSEMKELFFDSEILLQRPQTVYRIDNYASGRYYYTLDKGGEPTFYISVTNMVASTLPTNPHLVKWVADMGYDEAQEYKEERADYGTFLHMQIARLLIERQLNFDEMDEELKGYCKECKLPEDKHEEWIDEMQKDCIAFAQFMIDYSVKPIAIEIVLAHPDGYAGAIDLLADMTVEVKGYWGELFKSGPKKGQPKETKKAIHSRAYVDFKSGRKGFYESHEIQLESYNRMGRHNFPHLYEEGQPPIKLFNWSPKDWRTTPSYNLKEQTYSPNLEKFEHLVELAKIQIKKRKKQKLVISGVLNIDSVMSGEIELAQNYKLESIEKLIL